MKIAAVQFAPQFGLPDYNLDRALDLASDVRADLYVLPELATTGYQFIDRDEALRFAEPIPEGTAVDRLSQFARASDCHVICGLPERAGDQIFNSAVLVGPDGLEGLYRKAHLFYKESEVFDRGDTGFPIFDVGDIKVGILICFDWMFPEAARTLALAGADLIALPANLVLPWAQRAMVIRALENRVYTLVANRFGVEARGGIGEEFKFTGASRIVAPDGTILADAPAESDAVIVAEVDPAIARNKRPTPLNHVLEDRRPELYVSGQDSDEDAT